MLAEEIEIVSSKFALSKFYLNEELDHLGAIEDMLASLDILTTSNTKGIGSNGYDKRPEFSYANNKAGWKKRHKGDYKRKRDKGENTDTVSEDIAEHELTAGAGGSTKYDANGKEISSLLQDEVRGKTEPYLLETSSGKEHGDNIDGPSPSTVGKALDQIQAWVASELADIEHERDGLVLRQQRELRGGQRCEAEQRLLPTTQNEG